MSKYTINLRDCKFRQLSSKINKTSIIHEIAQR